MQQLPLHTICNMRFGLNVKTENTGEVVCLQGKDFNEYGHLKSKYIFRINTKLTTPKDFLKEHDILFAAKGYHHYAVVWNSQIENAVATSTFIILNGFPHHILPGYIAWLLNASQTKIYFNMHKKNGSIPVISKKILENLEIPVPDTITQQHIISLHQCLVKEKKLLHQIITKKEQFIDATIQSLFL